jgi:hypothetical protein
VKQQDLSTAVRALAESVQSEDTRLGEGSISALQQYLQDGSRSGEQMFLRSLIFLLYRIYGADIETLEHQLRRLSAMYTHFVNLYGDGPSAVASTTC